MANTTFNGPVRSEGGFQTITKNATTGAITTNMSISSSGVADFSANTLTTEAGTGITGGTGTVYRSSIIQEGGIITTRIMIDLTGLRSPATAGDIIGVDGTANPCHIGRISTSESGELFGGRMTCFEAPGAGDPDINVFAANEATGVENGAIGDLTETQLVDAGDATVGAVDVFTALPADGQYLYLTIGDVTENTYNAGRLLIEFFGYDA
jgi:hypothetical protein